MLDDHRRPAAAGPGGSRPRRLTATLADALLRRAARPTGRCGPAPVGVPEPPSVALYGFEAYGTWASAMLHNRSARPLLGAAPFVTDDDRALLGRHEGMPVAPGALVQVTFEGGTGAPPSPSRCFVEFTDPDGRPWVVGVDRPAPRPLAPVQREG